MKVHDMAKAGSDHTKTPNILCKSLLNPMTYNNDFYKCPPGGWGLESSLGRDCSAMDT
jgi:hypothetical protein